MSLLAAGPGAAADPAVLKTGRLTSLNNEIATGTVSLVRLADGRRVLRLRNARIGPGPALRVYLVAGRVDGDEDVTAFKDLGRLKSFSGNQEYPVRATVNTDRYATVVIWCREFSVAFGKAPLKRV